MLKVKLYGYDGEGDVHTFFLELPAVFREHERNLERQGKLVCIACRRRVGPGYAQRYTFSQFSGSGKSLTVTVVCDKCVVPIQETIAKVLNAAEQVRSNEATATAAGAVSSP